MNKDQILRVESSDINECRSFLRSRGLEYGPRPCDGWIKFDVPNLRGIIEYWNDRWHAAVYVSEI